VFALTSNRIVSLASRHSAAARLTLELRSGAAAQVVARAGAQAWEREGALPHVVVTAAGNADGVDMLHTRTPGARVAVDVAQALTARCDGQPLPVRHVTAEKFSGSELEVHLEAGSQLQIERFIAIHTERNNPDPGAVSAELARASAAAGWDEFRRAHIEAWAAAWARSDVEVDDPATQIGMRFAIAQLIAAAPPVGSRTSVAAKGLTGDGYKGHVFWDTDVFLMQFYSYTMPEVAREIIEYRIGTLPAARRNAQDGGVDGAWFAWESAVTGEDVTPDFVIGPGGRRMEVKTGKQEIHVVSDIVLAIDMYLRITGDSAILADGAAEVAVDAARFFATRGVETDRGYEIHDVIGPDELHEDVRNSAFTNYLAAWTLRWAADLVDTGVAAARDGEAERWRDLAARMVILRTPDGLLEQHEGFLSLPVVETDEARRAELAWQRDRQERRDVKQADVVMLMALREPDFTAAERLASFRLYEPLTRHLSSLSEAVHSLVARRVGLDAEADDYLRRAIAIDLYDSRGNRPEGLHMATQGGLWQAVVLGCAGLSSHTATLHLDPHLAPGWGRLQFAFTHHGVPGRVALTPTSVEVEAYGGQIDVALPGMSATAADGRPLKAELHAGAWRAV
jgi:trehalose/maltose hydrolase-like predicted phosphorylase